MFHTVPDDAGQATGAGMAGQFADARHDVADRNCEIMSAT
jgi:hypothetical protein